MKRFAYILVLVMLAALCLCGCEKKNSPEPVTETQSFSVIDFFADVSDVSGFQCLCTDSDSKQFSTENESAKELYKYIKEQMKSSEETDFADKNNKSVQLIFQKEDGEAEHTAETSEVMNQITYYGFFTVYDDDTLVFSGTPDASVGLCYKVPSGTYNAVCEKLNSAK